MMRCIELVFGILLVFVLAACGGSIDVIPDGGDGPDAGPDAAPDSGPDPFVPEAYGEWLKFEPEGAVCANGSQYKYFINFSETSDNVVIHFEGGSACWDYEDCSSGRPFNTDCINEEPGATCIRDDYATNYRPEIVIPEDLQATAALIGIVDGKVPINLVYPVFADNAAANPMHDWNKVFVTYCTGDVHVGNKVRTYVDPEGKGPDIEFHHKGHENTLAIIEDLNNKFPAISKMFVTGCSAGGVGSTSNYAFMRDGMPGVDKAYLLADSGPIIPASPEGTPSHSVTMHETVGEAWDLDSVISKVPMAGDITATNFGRINELLAEAYPDDRLTMTVFSLDYNFTLHSYERFNEFFQKNGVNTAAGRAKIYELFAEDLQNLRDQYDDFDNLGYYIPFYRTTNSSHCSSITALEEYESIVDLGVAILGTPDQAFWKGTEIQADEVTLLDYVEHVLDDGTPLQSYFEDDCEGHFSVCVPGCADGKVDLDLCDDAINCEGPFAVCSRECSHLCNP